MSEPYDKSTSDSSNVGRPIVVYDGSPVKRLPGRDLELSDEDDDEVQNIESHNLGQPIEIIEEKPSPQPRKSSLLVNPFNRVPERKRSVTFEPVDVVGVRELLVRRDHIEEDEAEPGSDLVEEMRDDESSANSLSKPISFEHLRLRVSEELPDSPPPRGSKRLSEARPPTPPGASHRVKYPKTPPPTPMDTKYI